MRRLFLAASGVALALVSASPANAEDIFSKTKQRVASYISKDGDSSILCSFPNAAIQIAVIKRASIRKEIISIKDGATIIGRIKSLGISLGLFVSAGATAEKFADNSKRMTMTPDERDQNIILFRQFRDECIDPESKGYIRDKTISISVNELVNGLH